MEKRRTARVIAWVAVLTLAVMGTAQALPGVNSVNSRDIINGAVKRVDLRIGAVDSSRLKDNSVESVDIADGAVTGSDIADSTITETDLAANSVGASEVIDSSLTGSDVASSSLTGVDVATDSLTGADVSEATLNFGNLCESGLVHSWARVKGAAGMPAGFTSSTTYRDVAHNCSGGSILVRRVSTGVYHVRFTSDPAFLALATVHAGDGDNDNIVSVEKVNATDFEVILRDVSDGAVDEGWFTIMTF